MNKLKTTLLGAAIVLALSVPVAQAQIGAPTTLISGEVINGSSTNSAGWIKVQMPGGHKDISFQLSSQNSNTITVALGGSSNLLMYVQRSVDGVKWDPSNLLGAGAIQLLGWYATNILVTNFSVGATPWLRVYVTNQNAAPHGLYTNVSLTYTTK